MTDSVKGFEDAFTAAAEALADGIAEDFRSRAEEIVTAIVTADRIDSAQLKETLRDITLGPNRRRRTVAGPCGCAA
jgi:hypothetical protein